MPPELVYDFEVDDPSEAVMAPYAVLQRFREHAPDLFYLARDVRPGREGGTWVVQTAELMREVFQDGVTFSTPR